MINFYEILFKATKFILIDKILKRLTITTHADSDALFETAILTAISVDSEDAALLILGARTILNLLLNAPTKEALRITNKTLVNLTVTV